MDPRVLILAVPSAVILGMLVYHSAKVLPRARAAAFWCAVAAYGVVRAAAVTWVTALGLGAPFPYVIHDPLFPVLGVPLQEIAGWGIVAYLGWWLGCRFSTELFSQVAWASLFLGAVSWAVEAAAVAAGWWHWTVPVSVRLFINVPFIGLIDWFFVGIDFLLPFLVLTAPALGKHPARYLALLAFPAHFASHCFVNRIGTFPIPVFHLVHWILVGVTLWLALRSRIEYPAFARETERGLGWLPIAALGLILLDAAAVELLLVGRPELLPSLAPALAATLQTLRPAWGYMAGAAAAVAGVWLPSLLPAALPAAAAALIGWRRRLSSWLPVAAMTLLALLAICIHAMGARNEEELTRRLDRALAARDRGDLATAEAELEAARRKHPGSHVPPLLLGEIHYRTERLDEAREHFLEATRIKQDNLPAFRHLAVIHLRRGDRQGAAHSAQMGLRIQPEDLELQYLRHRAAGGATDEIQSRLARLDARQVQSLASLAYEVGDLEGAVHLLEDGMTRWPSAPWFYRTRLKLALAAGDDAAGRRVITAWRRSLPGDGEAEQAARQLGME